MFQSNALTDVFPETLAEQFDRIAMEQGVSPKLLKAVCWVETRHNPLAFRPKDGRSASYGVCQVKMRTALHVGLYVSGAALQRPEVNITVAALYLRHQLRRYKGNMKKAISAYNAGSYKESNNAYVHKVMRQYARSI
jgi:soluble lytic murein transglycosylase-like protein